jgi:hypothetical protein
MSNDDESNPMLLPLPIEVMSVILCEVNKTDTIFELQSKYNIVEGTKSKKESTPDVFDEDFGSYLSQFSRNIYNPYVTGSIGGGFDDNDGMRDLLRRLNSTD